MRYVVAVDIGTTSVKAAIFTEKLKLVSISIKEYTLDTPRNGYVELSPAVYWENMAVAIGEMLREGNINCKDILSITCTTQGETIIPVDINCRPLYPAIVWLDSRAAEQAAQISEKFSMLEFYQKTGLPEVNGYCPISKILWFKQCMPDIYAKTHKFLLLEDYLLYQLTGQFITNQGLVCSTGYYDIFNNCYWVSMLDYCGIPESKLATVKPCGIIVGNITAEAAEFLGLGINTVVTTGAMDQLSSAVGSGNIQEGNICETTGTCQVVSASCKRPNIDKLSAVSIYRHAVSGLFLKVVISQTAGMVYKWFRDEFCAELMSMGEAEAFAVMDRLAGAAPAGSNGLILYPHLSGIQFPYSNELVRGAFVGVGLDTGRECFIRSIMEGIGYMLQESVSSLGFAPKRIISLGGGAKSELWCQIKANICNVTIMVPDQEESTLLGAAMLGAVAVGLYDSIAHIYSIASPRQAYQPSKDLSGLYDDGYQKYLKLHSVLGPIYNMQ